MKRCLLLFLIGLCGLSDAQPVRRNLLGRFSEQEIARALIPLQQWHPFPETAQTWSDLLPDSVRESILTKATRYAAMPFESLPASLMLEYVRTGNRKNYEKVSFQKRQQLFILVLAESLERKGRFVNAIADGVWSICEESFWGVPAHLGMQNAGTGLADVTDPVVDLFAAETAATLALTNYLTGKELNTVSPQLPKRIYDEVNRRVIAPLEKDSKRYWYFGEHPNNWNPWITSNWMISLLLLEKDETRRAAELHHAMVLTDGYMDEMGEDGATDEGPGYWFAAMGKVFTGLQVIHSATGGRIDIFGEPFIRLASSYIYKVHISDHYFISVADAYPVLHPDGLFLFRFGKAVRDTTLQQFGSWFFHHGGQAITDHFGMADQLWNLTELKNAAAEKASLPLLSDTWLSSLQMMIVRTPGGLLIASHGGHNAESHNHNDVGDFVLYAHGQPVIIDVGSGTYVAKTFSKDRYTLWYNSSAYHNVPLINGHQQQAGREFKAKQVRYTSAAARTSLSMDIGAAYPFDARMKQWIRTITVDKRKTPARWVMISSPIRR